MLEAIGSIYICIAGLGVMVGALAKIIYGMGQFVKYDSASDKSQFYVTLILNLILFAGGIVWIVASNI